MIETAITALIAFISSNIDDIFILMTLFAQAPLTLHRKHIITGQYLGIITLIALSLIGSLIGIFVPEYYIGLLGLVPIYLGGKKIYENIKNKTDESEGFEIKDPQNT